jgi:thiol:disulfide interchange protein
MLMLRLLLYAFVLLVSTGFACDSPKPTAAQPGTVSRPKAANPRSILWVESPRLMPVLELAQHEKMPVFVEFHADWCAPCKVLEEEVFTQENVFVYFNSAFLNFRTNFDTDNGKTVAGIYEVTQLPTVLFLDPNGVVLARQTGAITASSLRALGEEARRKMP